MSAALESISDKNWTISKAAKEHGIPQQTLKDRVTGKYNKGRKKNRVN